jgi:spore maturation protein SpmB
MESTTETCPKGNVLSNRLSGNFAINVAASIAPVYGISTAMLSVSTLVQKKADSTIQRFTVFVR